MAKTTNQKLRTLKQKEQSLLNQVASVQEEQRKLIAPLKNKMMNCCDRAITNAITENIDLAMAKKFAPVEFENRLFEFFVEYFQQRLKSDELSQKSTPETLGVALPEAQAEEEI